MKEAVRSVSRGHKTTTGYRVEARCPVRTPEPTIVAGTNVTESWAALSFDKGPVGVPNHIWDVEAAEHGLLTYSTATALMAWASASLGWRSWGVEFRLVKFVCKTTYEVTEVGVGQPVSFIEHEREEGFTARNESPATPSAQPSPEVESPEPSTEGGETP